MTWHGNPGKWKIKFDYEFVKKWVGENINGIFANKFNSMKLKPYL